VAKGERITITRHGVPAAMLVPIGQTIHGLTHQQLVEAMRQLRKQVKPGKMSVRAMINEGWRF
jgi:prevent-host-death family protein